MIIVRGMKALGDCLYQRPYVRQLAEQGSVYLGTPWPQLYADLPNVRCYPVETGKIMSQLNQKSNRAAYHCEQPDPHATRVIKVHNDGGAPVRIGRSFGHEGAPLPPECPIPEPFTSDMPNLKGDRFSMPIAVVRPPAVRSDWRAGAREPGALYVYEAAERLHETHRVVLVGGAGEEIVGPLPPHHENWLGGKLPFEAFAQLIASADIVVSGVGSTVPLCIAFGTRALIILGGRGKNNSESSLVDPTWSHELTFVRPDPFCEDCDDPDHACNRVIPDFDVKLESFLSA